MHEGPVFFILIAFGAINLQKRTYSYVQSPWPYNQKGHIIPIHTVVVLAFEEMSTVRYTRLDEKFAYKNSEMQTNKKQERNEWSISKAPLPPGSSNEAAK